VQRIGTTDFDAVLAGRMIPQAGYLIEDGEDRTTVVIAPPVCWCREQGTV
jgi:hypothetical protein